MAKKRKKPLARGPKGGKKHTPGRDHDAKSDEVKKRRFTKNAAKNRAALEEEARRQWAEWDALTPFHKRILHEQCPKLPRPNDGPARS